MITLKETRTIITWLNKGSKLSAVKAYKEMMCCGLKEAKNVVDAMQLAMLANEPIHDISIDHTGSLEELKNDVDWAIENGKTTYDTVNGNSVILHLT